MLFLSYTMDWDWIDVLVLAAVGYAVVLLVLALLVYIYRLMPKVLGVYTKRKLRRQGKYLEGSVIEEIPADVNAAIGLALAMYLNPEHDEESNIITIKRVSRTYSPWNSKIYGVSGVFSR